MIELILTLLLFGLLVSLALPTFTRFGEYVEKEMFLKLLASDLEYAKLQAVSSEEEIIVYFDTDKGWIKTIRGDQILRKIKIPYHFNIETNFAQNRIVFRHSGQSLGGTIQLRSGKRIIGRVLVQVASGLPKVELIPQ